VSLQYKLNTMENLMKEILNKLEELEEKNNMDYSDGEVYGDGYDEALQVIKNFILRIQKKLQK
jgi:division protein CdvB (Snf7/Vps24/ESCRT-III family)